MRSLFGKILKTPVVTEPITVVEDDRQIVLIARQIEERTRKLLGRSLHIREVDAGSCNGCEVEIIGLTSPYYDLERFGLHFVASPRHADCLLVTGPVTRNMAEPLRLTYEATPEPKIVIAVGDCARDCGVFKGSYAVAGKVADIIPVDVIVPGCPPEPADILRGILTALDRL
jgi:Ni,Fe-hydrogenase III small subunit